MSSITSRSMPMPRPPAGRHTVAQSPHKVVIHLRHRVFFFEPGQLGAEQFFLQIGVVQLGIGVGYFHAVDE